MTPQRSALILFVAIVLVSCAPAWNLDPTAPYPHDWMGIADRHNCDGMAMRARGDGISIGDREMNVPVSFGHDVIRRRLEYAPWITLRTVGSTLKVVMSDDGGRVVDSYELPFTCEAGWIVINETPPGGTEGFIGTGKRRVRLTVDVSGNVVAHVVSQSQGLALFVIPDGVRREQWLRFLAAKHGA